MSSMASRWDSAAAHVTGVDAARRLEDVGRHRTGQDGLHVDVIDGRRAATSRCRHSVSARTACLLMMYGACRGTTATPPIEDRFHTHAGVACVDHPGQERTNAVKDTADVDVDDAVPVVDRACPTDIRTAPRLRCSPTAAPVRDRGMCVRPAPRVRSGRARRTPRRRRCRPPRSTRRVARRRTAPSTSASTTVMPNAVACRARPAPMPAPAPVMTATPPPKCRCARLPTSRALTRGGGGVLRAVFGERNRILGVENDIHRREHQTVRRRAGCRRRRRRWTRRTGRCW